MGLQDMAKALPVELRLSIAEKVSLSLTYLRSMTKILLFRPCWIAKSL
jgi:hypothetical protein